MSPYKELDVFGRMVTIRLQSRKEPLRVHFDLIKDFSPNIRWDWWSAPDQEKPDDWLSDPDYVDDDTTVAFVRWLYTGAVEFSDAYFNTVADVLRRASIIKGIYATGPREWVLNDFYDALTDHAIGMITDTERELNMLDSIDAILKHPFQDDPTSGLGLFLVDWVVYGRCEVASVFDDIMAAVQYDNDFQIAIATTLLTQKAEEKQDGGTLPWNGDPCRYHRKGCYADVCVTYKEESAKGNAKAQGVFYQSKAPKETPRKRTASNAGAELEAVPMKKRGRFVSKKKPKKNVARAEDSEEDDGLI